MGYFRRCRLLITPEPSRDYMEEGRGRKSIYGDKLLLQFRGKEIRAWFRVVQ